MFQPPISAPPFNKLLASLPADDYQRILPHMKAVPLRFKQVLHKQGERIQDIYFPGGGACSMTKVMENGEAAEIATIGNEGLVGASVFFGDDQSVGETLIQVPDGSGYMMALEPFIGWIREEMRFATVGELVSQMDEDSAQARTLLARSGEAFPALGAVVPPSGE